MFSTNSLLTLLNSACVQATQVTGCWSALTSHLSQRGFALEEVGVFAALCRVELGVEENAPIGYSLQGGGALVGEG